MVSQVQHCKEVADADDDVAKCSSIVEMKTPTKTEWGTEVIDIESNGVSSFDSTAKSPSLIGNAKRMVKKYGHFIGPGLMVAVAYIDPGNYATAVSAGAMNEYSLLCIILVSNCIAIFLQTLCAKLGSVTGMDLSRACRAHLPMWMNLVIYVFAECCIIATDVAEVIGTAIALNILFKIPLPAGVAITVADVLIILVTYRPGSSMRLTRIYEFLVALLVLGVFICFVIQLAYLPSTVSAAHVFRGFVPSHQMFQNNGIYTAISILGATVMPHSLFLGSGLVQPRLLEFDVKHGNYSFDGDEKDQRVRDEKYYSYKPSYNAIKYCMNFSICELAMTLLTFALFINCAILVVAGASLYGSEEAANADLFSIHDLLSRSVAPAAGTLFTVALLLSGQSAGIVCTMAGQIVSEGHINWKLAPWQRRLLTRCISIIPCLVISISLGKEAMSEALNASQVVLSLLLPFLVAPLIYFTSSKKIMEAEFIQDKSTSCTKISNEVFKEESHNNFKPGEDPAETVKIIKNMENNLATKIVAVLIWIFLTVLNVYAIVQLGLSHGDLSA